MPIAERMGHDLAHDSRQCLTCNFVELNPARAIHGRHACRDISHKDDEFQREVREHMGDNARNAPPPRLAV